VSRSQPPRLDGDLVLGVDFTSAPSAKKPITVAVGRWLSAAPLPVYRLEEIRGLASLEAYESFLAERGPWLGGFDLPFGQPRSLIAHEGWPDDWRFATRSVAGATAGRAATSSPGGGPTGRRDRALPCAGPTRRSPG
jgi:hypothetical protein